MYTVDSSGKETFVKSSTSTAGSSTSDSTASDQKSTDEQAVTHKRIDLQELCIYLTPAGIGPAAQRFCVVCDVLLCCADENDKETALWTGGTWNASQLQNKFVQWRKPRDDSEYLLQPQSVSAFVASRAPGANVKGS